MINGQPLMMVCRLGANYGHAKSTPMGSEGNKQAGVKVSIVWDVHKGGCPESGDLLYIFPPCSVSGPPPVSHSM